MTQRHHHYELAFETFLRSRRIPYVAVDEARKALLPDTAALTLQRDDTTTSRQNTLKSFDFVIYATPHTASAPSSNLLVEIKGRKIIRRVSARDPASHASPDAASASRRSSRSQGGRLDSWVTRDDVESLQTWERLFGPGFSAAFVFLYWCEDQPPDALFQEIFEHRGRWYAVRAVLLADYCREMKVRSPKWGTMHVPHAVFERISRPFTGR